MNNEYSGKERRKFKRLNVDFTVFYRVNSPLLVRMRLGDKDIDALAVDISEGGIAVLTDYDVPALSIVTARFTMLDENAISAESRTRSIVVQGEVRYNILLEKEKEYRLGIEFIGLSDDDRNFIANFIRAQG